MKECSISWCHKPLRANSYCVGHNARYKKGQDLDAPFTGKTVSEQDRFWGRVDKTDNCWFWKGHINEHGYGQFSYQGSNRPAHRVSWIFSGKVLRDGFVLDHRCHERSCVNPSHLREVTRAQNAQNRKGSWGSSGVRGVYKIPGRDSWRVILTSGGVRYDCGVFSSLEDAEYVAREKRNEIFTHDDYDKWRELNA